MPQSCSITSYNDMMGRKDVLAQIDYYFKLNCCDAETCDALSHELEKLSHKCNDVFGKNQETDDKGNIISQKDTICGNIKNLQHKLTQTTNIYLGNKGGRKPKPKPKTKRIKLTRKNRTRKNNNKNKKSNRYS